MTTVTWMWIGNKPMLDNSPNTNISQNQANAALGWTASGSDELKAVDVTGPNTSVWNLEWNTTYQWGTDNFSYARPGTGSNTSTQIVTFVSATFEIETEDAHGNRITLTKTGVLKQAANGDVFIRPAADTVDEWSEIKVLYGIKVIGVSPLSDGTTMAQVGFNPDIKDVVIPPPCFAAGTLIDTDCGEVAVEALRPGDRVWTRDEGYRAVTWVGGRRLDAATLAAWPNLRPIRIAAGALGIATPARDLVVSPQHRILVRSAIAGRMFGEEEVLVAAKHLLGLPGIAVAEDLAEVDYVHFMLGAHAVVRSNGAETESLFPGPEAMKGIPPEARAEIVMLFPELAASAERPPEPARLLPRGAMARKLAERHAQKGRELVS